MRRILTTLVIGVVLGLAGCSSSNGGEEAEPTTSVAPVASTTSAPRRPSSTLSFREVRDVASCKRTANNPTEEETLRDRYVGQCIALGPVLIGRSNLASAGVVYDQTRFDWAVNVHFADDEFRDKVALPMIGSLIAIMVDGEVQSVPELNPGVAPRDIQIHSNYSKQQAIRLAADLTGVDPSQVKVNADGAPT